MIACSAILLASQLSRTFTFVIVSDSAIPKLPQKSVNEAYSYSGDQFLKDGERGWIKKESGRTFYITSQVPILRDLKARYELIMELLKSSSSRSYDRISIPGKKLSSEQLDFLSEQIRLKTPYRASREMLSNSDRLVFSLNTEYRFTVDAESISLGMYSPTLDWDLFQKYLKERVKVKTLNETEEDCRLRLSGQNTRVPKQLLSVYTHHQAEDQSDSTLMLKLASKVTSDLYREESQRLKNEVYEATRSFRNTFPTLFTADQESGGLSESTLQAAKKNLKEHMLLEKVPVNEADNAISRLVFQGRSATVLLNVAFKNFDSKTASPVMIVRLWP